LIWPHENVRAVGEEAKPLLTALRQPIEDLGLFHKQPFPILSSFVVQ
jgi:hypothetical protein